MLHENVESTEKVSPIILHAQGYKIKTGKEGEKVRFGGGDRSIQTKIFLLGMKKFSLCCWSPSISELLHPL